MNFFFDYIYYRITKAYFKWDGRESITAIIAISMIQVLLIVDIAAIIIRTIYTRTETIPYAKTIGYSAVIVLISLIIFNRIKYHKRYNEFRKYWQSEPKKQYILKTIYVFLSIVLPWIPLILIGVYL